MTKITATINRPSTLFLLFKPFILPPRITPTAASGCSSRIQIVRPSPTDSSPLSGVASFSSRAEECERWSGRAV